MRVFVITALLVAASEDKGASARTPHLTDSLVSEHPGVVPGQPFCVALNFDIIPEWHTYWRNLGDSGNPTIVDWSLPQVFSASEIHWPYPQRLPVGSLMIYGLQRPGYAAGRDHPARRLGSWPDHWTAGRCKMTGLQGRCIPEEGSFRLSLPVLAAS